MAIAGLGNSGVSTTKIEALAGELRRLKGGMADMQGRLDALLIEIDAQLQGAQTECEPAAEVLADLQDDAPFAEAAHAAAVIASEPAVAETLPASDADIALELIEAPQDTAAGEIEAVVTEPTAELVEAAQAETIASVEVTDTAAVVDAATLEPAQAETADAAVSAEQVAEMPTIVDAIPTVPGIEAVAAAEPVVEPIAETVVETPVAELPGHNVVLLAEHRTQAGKSRGVVARTARWAAVIALIATVAAIAAAGTGFAGNGELLIKSICAVAGDSCSITLGMP